MELFTKVDDSKEIVSKTHMRSTTKHPNWSKVELRLIHIVLSKEY